MRRATKIIAASFGLFAGFGGLEHGYFEILQGNARPQNMMIASIGAPCVPEEIWHLCEPAMTILPNFLMTGILSMLLGLVTMIWAGAFLQRSRGAAVLMLLSIGLLLFGGGIFPPLIGVVGGGVGTKINTPLKRESGAFWRVLAKAWPWTIILLFVGLFGQFVIGYFFNDFLMEYAAFLLFLPVLLLVSILIGYAHDLQNPTRA